MSSKYQQEVTCKPLDTFEEILMFLENPPQWRFLCEELTPHSDYKIKNTDINPNSEINVYEPQSFCHFSPDADGPTRRSDGKILPKTLVCHDMANGYHDDCYIDGTTNYEAYTFYNWAGIDIFCYFSHHFITIPPLGWINVGHAHGVKVIGTVITEWENGTKIWDEVLESETKYRNFASRLVAIAKTLKFDGWLLNIENKVTKPGVLLAFVQYLNTLLHEKIPHAELIWYDSVTVAGSLSWQNALNDNNRAFFDACDGIFLNYSWTEHDITSSSIEAADRITDLYVGIDVWGRGSYGGGQFNTQQAVKLINEKGCSLAIFAPGWTYEAMSNSVAAEDQLSKLELFQLRDSAFWGSLWPLLNTRLPCMLPFSTSFCRGQGEKRRMFGEVTSPSPWYNLRAQQYQPNSALGAHCYVLSAETRGHELDSEEMGPTTGPLSSSGRSMNLRPGQRHARRRVGLQHAAHERECFQLFLGDSFTGGAALRLHPSDATRRDHRHSRLFHCDFSCEETLLACVVTKPVPGHEAQYLNVKLIMKGDSNDDVSVMLAGGPMPQAPAAGIRTVAPLQVGHQRFKDLQRYLLQNVPGFYVPIENSYGWSVSYYEVHMPGSRVMEVDVRTGLDRGPHLLGHFGLCHKPADN